MDCDPTYNGTLAGMMGFIVLVDPSTGARLTESLRSIVFLDRHNPGVGDLMVVKNTGCVKSNSLRYKVKDLDGVYSGLTNLARVAFRFKSAGHQLVVQADDCSVLFKFLRVLHSAVREKGFNRNLDKDFDPVFKQYLSTTCIDKNDLNFRNLNNLVLENVKLPTVPKTVSQVPVSYLSLSGSTLGDNDQQDDFWDWLTPTVSDTLTHLEMNSMGLKEVPYEIMYMSNLNTLSLAKNKLKYLPHFVGELKELECLYINGNLLEYLPGCLQEKTFKHLNITDNNFKQISNSQNNVKTDDVELRVQRTKKSVCQKLSNLSFHLFINNRMKVSRKDLPQALRHYYYTLYRCKFCSKFISPDCALETFYSSWAKTSNIITNFNISWQFFECRSICSQNVEYFCTFDFSSTRTKKKFIKPT